MCIALLAGCAAALAEEKENLGAITVNGQFMLQCILPEGYTTTIYESESDHLRATIETEDTTKPGMVLTVAYADDYSEVGRMNDLDDEQLGYIEASFTEEDEVTIEYRETSHGTKLMVVREVGDGMDFVDVFSIYQGYFVEFLMLPGPDAEDTTLTEEQIQMCVDFLSDLDFVPIGG